MRNIQHQEIALDTYECILTGELVQKITNPGQFLQIQVADNFLRRPISIASFDKETEILKIIYKVVGKGTAKLATYKSGDYLDIIGPLGNGFDIEAIADLDNIVLVGGGIGVPPLYSLLQELTDKYPLKNYLAILGFQTAAAIFYDRQFMNIAETIITTDDGSFNPPAQTVITALEQVSAIDYIYTCGPAGMLNVLSEKFPTIPLQLSYEERMACGVGLCMGCIHKFPDGTYIRVCKDGPVVERGVTL